MRVGRIRIAAALGALLASWGVVAHAADHDNLEDGQPTTLADAYAAPYLERQVHGIVRYERTPDDEHQLLFEPRFEFGFPRNAQISVFTPVKFVDFEKFKLGRFGIDAFYNLNQETLTIPALALGGGVEAPTSEDAHGFDPYLQVYLSKLLPGMDYWNGVHVNGRWQFNTERGTEERSGRYRIVVGYAFRISASMIAIIDGVREQMMKTNVTEDRGELGVRYQITPLIVGTLGGAAGVADDTFVARATAGLQYYAF
jgi:hypothetical protein